MKFLITGGTGFIGGHLVPHLLADGHELTVLTRRPGVLFQRYGDKVKSLASLSHLKHSDEFDVVINLAGEGIADRPWTAQRKQELHVSRVTLTEELVAWIKSANKRPELMISGSAVGWYGNTGDKIRTEEDGYTDGFMHQLCQQWEAAAKPVEALGVRLCIIRTGVVLGRGGGMMRKLLPIFTLGLGGRLGHGDQWLSWIAIDDYLGVVDFLMAHEELSGVFNGTAPAPVTNTEFTHAMAHTLHRPAVLTVPEGMLRFAMGEMSEVLLTGQRVLPTRLLESGFRFRHPAIEDTIDLVAHGGKAPSQQAA